MTMTQREWIKLIAEEFDVPEAYAGSMFKGMCKDVKNYRDMKFREAQIRKQRERLKQRDPLRRERL